MLPSDSIDRLQQNAAGRSVILEPTPKADLDKFTDQALLCVILVSTFILAVIAIYRTWQVYNPVPVWDMWRGYLGFYEKAAAHDWNAWIAPHSEHRMILGRLLFWMDIRWFKGTFVFLVLMNWIFVSMFTVVFWWVLGQFLTGPQHAISRLSIALLNLSLTCLLCQGENLFWAFQGVFWLAFLLPLLTFLFAAHSQSERGVWLFAASCFLALAAVGTMINGLITLPLLFIYFANAQRSLVRAALTGALTIAVTLAYLHGTAFPVRSPGRTDGWHDIGQIITYGLAFMGAPFLFILKPLGANNIIAVCIGFFFFACYGFKICQWLRRRPLTPVLNALILYSAYLLLSAAAIVISRPTVEDQSVSRYTTIAILAWISLILFYSQELVKAQRPVKIALITLSLGVMISAIKAQSNLLDNWDLPVSDRRATILGLSLGIVDTAKIAQIAEVVDVTSVAERAYQGELGLFGRYPYRGARRQLGKIVPIQHNIQICRVGLEELTYVLNASDLSKASNKVLRIRGYLRSPYHERSIQAVRILRRERVEIGYAVAGQGKFSDEFRGYVFNNVDGSVVLQGEDRIGPICEVSTPFKIVDFGSVSRAN
jgi:hypothetical protein